MSSKEVKSGYKAVIGLEVHAQLQTESKIFSSDANSFGSAPNTNVSVISLGHPGVMPKLNKKAVEYAIKMGLACNCEISRYQYFDRKNYFYPDLPKGFQITQDKTPICIGGHVPVLLDDGVEVNVKLNRIHLEEDAGKSIHLDGEPDTLIDLNRAGVPLIEIVTEPVINSAEEAGEFLTEIRKIVRYLGICDGNMEEGSLRCDANVSVMKVTDTQLGKKVEVKNMNSIKSVVKAIHHEIDRQIDVLENGQPVISETRTFDVSKGTTSGMRTKEELNDYRYFPEPDLSPLEITEEWLKEIKKSMPALPAELKEKFKTIYGLKEYDATVLTHHQELALFFDRLCQKTKNYKAAANWAMGPVKSYLNEHNISVGSFSLSEQQIVDIIKLIDENHINFTSASQQLFPYLIENPKESADEAAHKLNIFQDSDMDSIQPVIDEVLDSLPQKVSEYRKGKKGLIGLFMGEVMKKTQGKVDPKVASKLLKETLEAEL